MGRSILAVVVGFFVTGLLVVGTTQGVTAAAPSFFDARGGTSSVGMLLVMQLYVAVFATFGCWLAARLAPSRPMRHALAVGVLGVLMNVASAVQAWELYPAWANVAGVVTAMLWAWLGGRIRERQLEGARGSALSTAAV